MASCAALENRYGVAIDNDERQFPLTASYVAHLQEKIDREHRTMSKARETRDEYARTLATRRFLNPLDTNSPGAGERRRQEREAKKQSRVPAMMKSNRGKTEKDEENLYRSLEDATVEQRDMERMNQELLEMALRQSKYEEEQRQKVSEIWIEHV